MPTIRIKLTGVCNRSCSFCHEEGDMRTIGEINPDDHFFKCVGEIQKALSIDRVILTGGEPTLHNQLEKIVERITAKEISMTSNGTREFSTQQWEHLKSLGLTLVILSIHDATVQDFLSLESRKKTFGWGARALANQMLNLERLCVSGIPTRINIVVYNNVDHTLGVIAKLRDLQIRYGFEIRLLNDLTNAKTSIIAIQRICDTLSAEVVGTQRRASSSNATTFYKSADGFSFSTKTMFRYFLNNICSTCSIKEQCFEGYYGVRIERRDDDYFVRLCIYKQSPDVLMPWRTFLQSDLPKAIRKLSLKEMAS